MNMLFISTVSIQCIHVWCRWSRLISGLLITWTFWLCLTMAGVSMRCCLLILFWEVSQSDLHMLTWPALKLLSPWQQEVWGRGAPTWKAVCCCLPTGARASMSPHKLHNISQQNIEPRNLYFESVPAVSICSQTDLFLPLFFVPAR